jgi:hypothetical protein
VVSSLLTTSRLRAARACQRLHQIQYTLGYRPVTEDDLLRFGSLIHNGQEAWWTAKQDGREPLEPALEALQVEADPFDKARAEAMMTGYHFRWVDQPYRVLGVEVQFETELRNPATGASSRTWRLAGKVDALVEDLNDHRVLLVEHKSSSEDVSAGSDYWKRLRMDTQVSIYFEGARAALGLDVSGCIYDVLSKPAQRPSEVPLLDEDGVKIVLDASGARVRTKDGKKWRQTGDTELGYVLQTRPETPGEFKKRLMEVLAENPERYFNRGEVVRLQSDMEEAAFDHWQLGQQLREAQVAGRFPRNPDSCIRYGRTCPYFDVCSGTASLDDPTRFRRLANIHPELELQKEETQQ